MPNLAEDVYYVTRDTQDVIGLNQLLQVPSGLSQIELEAIDTMAGRSETTMQRQTTATPQESLGTRVPRAHGLYYVDPDGQVWLLSAEGIRPDLDGTRMDFARATVRAGRRNLDALAQELRR